MVDSGVSPCNRCGSTTEKTFLGVKTSSASFVRQPVQARVLDPLRFLIVQLRHRLTVDGPGDCLLTICVISHKFPYDLELINMSTR